MNHFAEPLEKAGVDPTVLEEEWLDMVDYAKTYLNLVQEGSQTIWWKLASYTNYKKWVNILSLVELIFCLPMSNGHLEQVFSTLKLIKSERRTSLGENQLDNLLRVPVDSPALSDWNPDGAVQLWWKARQCRVVQDTRAPPCHSEKDNNPSSSDIDESYHLDLSEWDNFIDRPESGSDEE